MSFLSWATKKPGRVWLVSLYGAVIAMGMCLLAWFGWGTFWEQLNIPPMTPYFADTRIIQGAVLSTADGLDPQLNNPRDPWKRILNYPRIWVTIGQWMHIESEVGFLILGVSFVGVLIACGMHLLWQFPSRVLWMGLCSSATLLGMERGNTDLLMFGVIYVSAITSYPVMRSLTYLMAIVLKIYPLFAGIGIRIKPSHRPWIGFMVIGYLWLVYDQLTAISNGNNAAGVHSYGFKTILSAIKKMLTHPLGMTSDWLPWVCMMLLGLVLTGVLLLYRYRLPMVVDTLTHIHDRKKALFLSGAGIYCGTFLLASNWDYRLIFLILCLPLLRALPHAVFHTGVPCLIIVTMNMLHLDVVLPLPILAIISLGTKVVLFTLLLHLGIGVVLSQRPLPSSPTRIASPPSDRS